MPAKLDRTPVSRPFVLRAPEPIREIVEYVLIKHNVSLDDLFSDATFTTRDVGKEQRQFEDACSQLKNRRSLKARIAEAKTPRRYRAGEPQRNKTVQVARAEILARCHSLGPPYSLTYLATVFEVYRKTITYAFRTLDTWRLTYRDNGIDLPELRLIPVHQRKKLTTTPNTTQPSTQEKSPTP